jgi:hypothetical protein
VRRGEAWRGVVVGAAWRGGRLAPRGGVAGAAGSGFYSCSVDLRAATDLGAAGGVGLGIGSCSVLTAACLGAGCAAPQLLWLWCVSKAARPAPVDSSRTIPPAASENCVFGSHTCRGRAVEGRSGASGQGCGRMG